MLSSLLYLLWLLFLLLSLLLLLLLSLLSLLLLLRDFRTMNWWTTHYLGNDARVCILLEINKFFVCRWRLFDIGGSIQASNLIFKKSADPHIVMLLANKNICLNSSSRPFLFLKMGQPPRPLFVYYCCFKHKFYRKNCRCQQDLNSDRRSRRQARWPLDHTTAPPGPFLQSVQFFQVSSSNNICQQK